MSAAAELIERATVAGVTLKLVGGEVRFRGSRAAVAELIEPLREVKADVIRLLEEAAFPIDVHAESYQLLTRMASPTPTTAMANPAPEVCPTLDAPPPAAERPQPRFHIEAAWRPLAQAYHLHHTACKTCQSAGQGRGLRCGTGAAMWTRYSDSF